MYDREDFFAPEKVDERLDLSLLLPVGDDDEQERALTDPNLLLIHDLRYLYGEEGGASGSAWRSSGPARRKAPNVPPRRASGICACSNRRRTRRSEPQSPEAGAWPIPAWPPSPLCFSW
jgi:hypothetical protein